MIVRSGEPTLDKRADEDLDKLMSKNQKAIINKEFAAISKTENQQPKKKIYLGGNGTVYVKAVDSSKHQFLRDYPEIAHFNGSVKLGLKFVPSAIIPKHASDLYPELIQQAKEQLEQAEKFESDHKETLKELMAEIKQLENDNEGDIPERDAKSAIEEAFRDTFA